MKLPLRRQYIKKHLRKKTRKKPQVLQLPITSRCNSRCVTCGVYFQHEKIDIDAEQLKQALSDPFFSEVKTVGINGGEFTLVKSFFDIIDAVLTLPNISSLYLISNGLLPERLLEILKKTKQICDCHRVNLHFCLSVDGVGKIHETVRGVPNCFVKTVQVLDAMKTNRELYCHQMSIGCTISNRNVEYIWQTYQFLSELPFQVEYHLAVPNKRIGTFDNPDYYVLNDEKSRLLAAEFFYVLYLRTNEEQKKFQYFSNYYYLKNKGKRRPCECCYLYQDVTIDEKLNLYLCATASNSVGNLSQDTASQLYEAGVLDREAKRLTSLCDTCIHYSYHEHTLRGRIAFIVDYVPRQYNYQLFDLYSQRRDFKVTKNIILTYYHMLRKACYWLRFL